MIDRHGRDDIMLLMNWAVLAIVCVICAAAPGGPFTMRDLEQTPVQPVAMDKKTDGSIFIDFGKAAFGRLEVIVNAKSDGEIVVRLGEKAIGTSVDLHPGGSI